MDCPNCAKKDVFGKYCTRCGYKLSNEKETIAETAKRLQIKVNYERQTEHDIEEKIKQDLINNNRRISSTISSDNSQADYAKRTAKLLEQKQKDEELKRRIDEEIALKKARESKRSIVLIDESKSDKLTDDENSESPLKEVSELHDIGKDIDNTDRLIAENEELKRQILFLKGVIERLQKQPSSHSLARNNNSIFCRYDTDDYCVKYDFYPTDHSELCDGCSYSEKHSNSIITKEDVDEYLINHLEEMLDEIKEMKYSGELSNHHILDRFEVYESIIEHLYRLSLD